MRFTYATERHHRFESGNKPESFHFPLTNRNALRFHFFSFSFLSNSANLPPAISIKSPSRTETKKKKKKKRKGRKTPLHRSHVHRESARKNLAKAFSREITFPLRRRRNATVPLRGIISRGIAARASRLATRRRRNLDRLARK